MKEITPQSLENAKFLIEEALQQINNIQDGIGANNEDTMEWLVRRLQESARDLELRERIDPMKAKLNFKKFTGPDGRQYTHLLHVKLMDNQGKYIKFAKHTDELLAQLQEKTFDIDPTRIGEVVQ